MNPLNIEREYRDNAKVFVVPMPEPWAVEIQVLPDEEGFDLDFMGKFSNTFESGAILVDDGAIEYKWYIPESSALENFISLAYDPTVSLADARKQANAYVTQSYEYMRRIHTGQIFACEVKTVIQYEGETLAYNYVSGLDDEGSDAEYIEAGLNWINDTVNEAILGLPPEVSPEPLLTLIQVVSEYHQAEYAKQRAEAKPYWDKDTSGARTTKEIMTPEPHKITPPAGMEWRDRFEMFDGRYYEEFDRLGYEDPALTKLSDYDYDPFTVLRELTTDEVIQELVFYHHENLRNVPTRRILEVKQPSRWVQVMFVDGYTEFVLMHDVADPGNGFEPDEDGFWPVGQAPHEWHGYEL
jgi:hypothetical protein